MHWLQYQKTELGVARNELECNDCRCCHCLLIDKVAMLFLDFFDDECTEDAAEECNEFRVDVPLSDKFDAKAFKDYCE